MVIPHFESLYLENSTTWRKPVLTLLKLVVKRTKITYKNFEKSELSFFVENSTLVPAEKFKATT